MRSKGWTFGIIALASLAFVAVALALVATPADASITGTPFPTFGNDWIIDQDTTVLGESLTLQGDLYIEPGNTLKIRNSELLINSSFAGEHGIYIDSNTSAGDGTVELDDCTIKSDYADNGWYFVVDGALTITKARLYNVQDGLQLYSDNVDITNMTLNAQGVYGVYIYRCDPKIHNSEITVEGYSGYMVYGIRVYGSSSDLAAPDFDGLKVKVYRNDVIESTSSYTYIYFDMIGLDVYYGQFDTLSGVDIELEAKADVFVNYTGTPYVRVYYYVTGVQLSGGTMFNSMDLTVSDGTYFVDADTNANNGYLYEYNYIYGLRNTISSSGSSPAVFSGFTLMNHRMSANANNIFTERPYYYGNAVYWFPSSSATSGDSYTFDGIVIDNVEVEEMFEVDMNRDHIFMNCEILNSYMDDYLFDYYYMYENVKWQANKIVNNTMTRSYYFYIYRNYGPFTFTDNNFTGNTYYVMYYLYYSYEEVVFERNVFMNNKPHTSTYTFFYMYYISQGVEFDSNTFSGNNWQYFMYMYYPYTTVEFSNNNFINNTGSQWSMYLYYMQSAAPLEFSDNYMLNNTFNGWFYSYYQYNVWTIQDNHVVGNSFGNRGFFWLYGYDYGGGWDVTDNLFENNTCSNTLFEFFLMGYNGGRQFTFERNVFINNTGSTASTSGLVRFYKTKMDFSVLSCEFYNNTANCIAVYFDYKYSSSVYTNSMFFEDNKFYNNSGKGIAISEINDDYITIRDNEGYGNEDYVVWIDHSKGYQYISSDADHYSQYAYGYPNGPRMLLIEANNFSYNKGGGIYAKVSQYDSSYSSYNPGQPNADIRIKKNMLYGNGPDGYALLMDNLYRKPNVKSNVLDGSSMGQFWGLIPNDARYTPFDMEFRDIVLDGGPEGMTAYGFHNIDADFYDCKFTNFKKCFYADDCEVNVYWSGVPDASGETEGDGEINVYNHLEIWITWANATGVDSGVPVPNVIVAIQGANGDYFGATIADEEGKLFDPDTDEPMVVTPWTSKAGEMNAWSPFTITLLARENVSYAHEVSMTSDYIDPNPLRLALWDMFIPEVIIANPQDDTLVKTADVLSEGFLFEIGSGITTFEGRSDMMPEDEWVTITRNVLWQHVFPGMTEGYHNLSVRAADLSGNWNTSNIEIIVDLTKPDLTVQLEFLNATLIPYDETKGGYFVRDKEIAINGTYDDNYAGLGEVIIRINGVPKFIFPSQWGKIYERIELKQGINTLIVDATDTAGNRQERRLYISLDSFPPTMYIYNPLEGQMTADQELAVTGLTEPLTPLEIIVQASAGTNTYETRSSGDGTFEYPVALFEGIQKVLVTATDSAGNPTLIDRNVILDTTPPDFIINQPPEDYVVTKETRYTIVGTMTREPIADIYINGQWVENPGVFQREVVLQEGENVIEIKAIDMVGNENVKYVTIVRDTVEPELELTAPETDDIITNNPRVTFSGYVEGSTGVVIVHKSIRLPAELVTGTWESGEWKYDLDLGPQDLEQDVEVEAFDLAENTDVSIIHIRLDIVPPSLAIENVPETVTTPFVWINGTTDEGVAGVFVEGVSYAVTEGAFKIQWSLAAGENNLVVEVYDEAGNRAESKVNTYYDPPAPPPPPTDGGEETDWLSVMGIGILLAAIIILVTAVFIVQSRRRR